MKLLIATLLLTTTISAQALEVTANCQSQLTSQGTATITYQPFRLAPQGTTSQLINNTLGFDSGNSILVSLNESGKLCAEGNCEQTNGTVYTLSLVRFENPVQKAQNLRAGHNEKVKGETSATIEFRQPDSGAMTASYYQDGAFESDKKRLPRKIEIEYSVTRGFLKKRQSIKVACDLKIKK